VVTTWPTRHLEGLLMSVESLTYADLADRLGTTQEAARSLVRRLRLPRQTGNDGKVRINIDLAEIQYKPLPARSPGGHRTNIEILKARIAALQVELRDLETENSAIRTSAAIHRSDFERERDRADSFKAEAEKLMSAAMSARKTAARLEGQLVERLYRPWWKRFVVREQAATAAVASGRA
jgi:hypothetical protein